MNYPEIVIKDAWLLREKASKHLHELWAKESDFLADDKKMEEIVFAYKQAWRPYEKRIIEGMCSLTGLEFRHNIIDVYIAPWFHAFSDPLVIGVMHKPDEFIDVLTHELLHRLLTANTKVDIDKTNRKLDWQKLFGENHSFTTLVHIPVHAVHKAIYLDILNQPERLQRDIEHVKNNSDYREAWDYVEKYNYKEIIQNLKTSFD